MTNTIPPAGAVGTFRGPPESWLPAPTSSTGEGRWDFYLWVGQVGHLVVASIEQPVVTGPRVSRHVAWQGAKRRRSGVSFVPAFDGDLVLVADDAARTTLSLVGYYEPPLGLLGGLLDVLVGGRVARRCATTLVVDIAARLTQAPVTAT